MPTVSRARLGLTVFGPRLTVLTVAVRPRRKSPRHPQALLSLLGRFALALFLCAQVLVGLHHASVAHGVCSEHGELVHVSGGTHAGHCHSGEALAHDLSEDRQAACEESELPQLASGPEADEHGDHCTLPHLRDFEGTPSSGARLVVRPAVPGAQPAPLLSQCFGPSFDLLRMAPKQSPPA